MDVYVTAFHETFAVGTSQSNWTPALYGRVVCQLHMVLHAVMF